MSFAPSGAQKPSSLTRPILTNVIDQNCQKSRKINRECVKDAESISKPGWARLTSNVMDSSYQLISISVFQDTSAHLVERQCRAPRLTGWLFRLAVELLDSPTAGPLWDINFRRSGIPQAVRELDMPEPATFQPVWPLPAALDKDEILVEGHPVAERLMVASNGVPGQPSTSLTGQDQVFTSASTMSRMIMWLGTGVGKSEALQNVSLIDMVPNIISSAILMICGHHAGFKAGEERRKTGGKLDRRWTISDFAQAYAAVTTTPSEVAERVLRCVEDSERADPPMRFLIACNAADLRRNAAESTQRHGTGLPYVPAQPKREICTIVRSKQCTCRSPNPCSTMRELGFSAVSTGIVDGLSLPASGS